MANIHTAVVHCSASPHRADKAETVHRWHLENGWDGIGYHYTIDEFGDMEAGRPEYWSGAHTSGHNHNTIGIMLFGRGPQDFTEDQYETLRRMCLELKRRYPGIEFLGHSDLDPVKKPNCPGFSVRKWWQEQGV